MDPTIIKILLTLLGISGVGISLVGLPGVILVFISAAIYAIYTNFSEISMNALIVTGVITLLSLWVDNIAVLLGAKKYGASNFAMVGAFLGGLVGIILIGPFGVIVGPLVGAFLAEYYVNPHFKSALKAGFGTFLGYLFGTLLKFVITIILFIWVLTVIW